MTGPGVEAAPWADRGWAQGSGQRETREVGKAGVERHLQNLSQSLERKHPGGTHVPLEFVSRFSMSGDGETQTVCVKGSFPGITWGGRNLPAQREADSQRPAGAADPEAKDRGQQDR